MSEAPPSLLPVEFLLSQVGKPEALQDLLKPDEIAKMKRLIDALEQNPELRFDEMVSDGVLPPLPGKPPDTTMGELGNLIEAARGVARLLKAHGDTLGSEALRGQAAIPLARVFLGIRKLHCRAWIAANIDSALVLGAEVLASEEQLPAIGLAAQKTALLRRQALARVLRAADGVRKNLDQELCKALKRDLDAALAKASLSRMTNNVKVNLSPTGNIEVSFGEFDATEVKPVLYPALTDWFSAVPGFKISEKRELSPSARSYYFVEIPS